MTTSGSYDYNLTGTNIILESLELIGKAGVGYPVSSEDEATCLRTLNLFIKWLSSKGVGLWKNVEASLFQSYGGYSYSIGPSGDHCSPNAYKTEIATAADSGDSEIVVDSDDNISDGDYIGIELDDGTLQWTTVDGTPSSDTVGLDDVLTDDVAVDNHVYNYTSLIQRPTEIIEVRRINSDGTETPLVDPLPRIDYMALPDKSSTGSPIQVYYDPLLTNGKMWVYHACSDVKEYLKFTARIMIEDIDSGSQTADFPQEWLLPISRALAVLIAPKFGKVLDANFTQITSDLLDSTSGFDMEFASIYMGAKSWR